MNKVLITINNLTDIEKIKELGIWHYVFPLKGFCVGLPNTFSVSEIPNNEKGKNFIYINRILDNDSIDKLQTILDNLPIQINGIIFDDLGILELIKDKKVEKILYLSHFNSNIESIKEYLCYVDSVMISTDINRYELEKIITAIPNKLTMFTLGLVGVMYSRRLLIDNYSKYYNLEKHNPLVIQNTNHKFLLYENDYGTYFYALPCFNGLTLLNLKTKYNFINAAFLNFDDIKDLIMGKSKIETDSGFLDRELIYKLKGENND